MGEPEPEPEPEPQPEAEADAEADAEAEAEAGGDAAEAAAGEADPFARVKKNSAGGARCPSLPARPPLRPLTAAFFAARAQAWT
eukprot:COSAG04_NODE_109_length_25931_cov_38.787279_17_plen_84_part_00